MPDIAVLVVNRNSLSHTKNCIADLMCQNEEFHLVVADNHSTEEGAEGYFDGLHAAGVDTMRILSVVPLNELWNTFHTMYSEKYKYLCFLNNDTRVCFNFVESVLQTLDKEPTVGIVSHVSNNPEYSESKELEYVKKAFIQGWDWTIRSELYKQIPTVLRTYCGDNWQFGECKEEKAMILSSPIVHYGGQSKDKDSDALMFEDIAALKKLGYSSTDQADCEPSKFVYDLVELKNGYEPVLTVCVVTYERYDDLKQIIEMLLSQTDPRFVVDVWQDGPDYEKRKIVRSYNDKRIRYWENDVRQNKYGHDMRHKSLMSCETEYWCTTNDDNWISPYFVESILKAGKSDLIKYSVALLETPEDIFNLRAVLMNGITDFEYYSSVCKTLPVERDAENWVDASSFVARADFARDNGGWHSMALASDWDVYEKLLNALEGDPIRIPEVFQVHR